MQIQRIQTLWLILALAAAGVALAFPWLTVGAESFGIESNPILAILGALACLLPIVALIIFRNPAREKLVAKLSALMALASVAYVVALSQLGPDAAGCKINPLPTILMALSGIFDVMAARAIAADIKLLRSADRLR